MRRRDLLVLLAASGFCGSALPATAQQADRMRHIAVLMSYAETDSEAQKWVAAFRAALRTLGWTEGRNIGIEIRWATGDQETIGRLAKELVESRPELVLASTTVATAALLQQTRTIPIVFALVSDPVGSGFVASFPRPGGNVTGLSYLGTELAGKQIELLREAAPSLSRVAVLSNPANPTHAPRLRAAAIGAQGLRVHLEPIEARTPSELDKAFATMMRARVGGVLVLSDPMFGNEARRLAQLASTSGLATIYGFRVWVDAGGLMSYGPDLPDLFHRAAAYVEKLLKGAKPGDLPIEQPTTFELVINLRTAKALGLTIPPSLLLRADQVIE